MIILNNQNKTKFLVDNTSIDLMFVGSGVTLGVDEGLPSTTVYCTPVEYISNGSLSKIWIDLGYVFKTNSRIQMKVTFVNNRGGMVIGEYLDDQVSGWDNNDLRFFVQANGKFTWDVVSNRMEKQYYSSSNNPYEIELGNYYIKNLKTNSNIVTGSTYTVNRTGTIGLFGWTDSAKFYYIKIYEDDTLVMDIIPVLDTNNIPCLLDKVKGQFIYYKVNGEPSTGLSYGNAAQPSSFVVPEYQIQNLSLTVTNKNAVAIDGSLDLKATASNTGSTLFYESSNPRVAKVDSNGIVSGLTSGETTIKITAQGFVDETNKVIYSGTTQEIVLSCVSEVPSSFEWYGTLIDGTSRTYTQSINGNERTFYYNFSSSFAFTQADGSTIQLPFKGSGHGRITLTAHSGEYQNIQSITQDGVAVDSSMYTINGDVVEFHLPDGEYLINLYYSHGRTRNYTYSGTLVIEAI